MKESVSNFEPRLSLVENKKTSIDNQIIPYLADSRYSQANYQITDEECLHDVMKESAPNCESQAPLLVNKKSLIGDAILFDFADPHYNKAKYQNHKSMCLQDFTKESVGNSKSQTPLLVNKQNLIDYHIPPDLVCPCYSQRENVNSKDICHQDFTNESAGNFELQKHLFVDTKNLIGDHIPLDTVTDIFSSSIKLPYYSKYYHKVYYKYLIDPNFYKLRKETRTKIFKTKNSKPNLEKQYCNQVQGSINSTYNVSNENDKTYNRICLKNNTSDNNLRQYGFCNETSNNSNNSALQKISGNFDSSVSKAESSTDISDVFLTGSESFDDSNKSISELPKFDEKAVQPTVKTDEKHTDDITSITDPITEIYYSCSEEFSEFENERDMQEYMQTEERITVPSRNCNEKAFNSSTTVVKGYTKGKRKLFEDVKIDNVKRGFNILGPSFKPDIVRL